MTTEETDEQLRTEDFEAFKKALADVPSQDNEGYRPNRGGYKCGWFDALRWERNRARANPPKEVRELIKLLEDSLRCRRSDAPEDAEVKALGKRIGFGALMDSATKGWREVIEESGWPSGGEFTVGHCRATVEQALRNLGKGKA